MFSHSEQVNKKGRVAYKKWLDEFTEDSRVAFGSQPFYRDLGQLEYIFRLLDTDRYEYVRE